MPRIDGVNITSAYAYHDLVITGRATDQRERILRYLLNVTLRGEAKTRRVIANAFKDIGNGRAADGLPPIMYSSVAGRCTSMLERDEDLGKHAMLKVAWYGKQPGGRTRVEWLQANIPGPTTEPAPARPSRLPGFEI